MRLKLVTLLFVASLATIASCAEPAERAAEQQATGPNRAHGPVDSSAYLTAEAREIGCQIVTSYTADKFAKAGKPIVLRDSSEVDIDLSGEDARYILAYLVDGEDGDPESQATIGRAQAFLALASESAIERCAGLSEIMEEHSFSPDPRQEQPPISPDGLFFEYDTNIVSMPLVDIENGMAFMWAGHGCGPLCGGTGIEIFTRQTDGSWSRTDYAGISIS